MRRALEDATARVLMLLTVAVWLGLATLVPALFASDGPNTATVVLALALAALMAIVLSQVRSNAAVGPVAACAGHRPPPLLTERVTDPVHHPLRPRAPGLA
ncbi:MAG: hypothetical protein ACTHOD_05835 [Motilibacteraceae bacterium]